MTVEKPFDPFSFRPRHIGPSPEEVHNMLRVVQAPTLDALIDEAIPSDIRQEQPLNLGSALSEPQLLAKMQQVASQNRPMTSLIGQGYYRNHLPLVIQRNVLENPAWYTAYTPYQPEISQGRLEALLNFQTMIVDLTGMEIANASLLDEATAAAEAMVLARRVTQSAANAFFVDSDCHPQTGPRTHGYSVAGRAGARARGVRSRSAGSSAPLGRPRRGGPRRPSHRPA